MRAIYGCPSRFAIGDVQDFLLQVEGAKVAALARSRAEAASSRRYEIEFTGGHGVLLAKHAMILVWLGSEVRRENEANF
jgi:hypothetical protein